MSFVPITTGTNAASAAAIRKLLEEEENMTAYNKEDLEGWEFKIMRSYTGKFKDTAYVRQLCQEEAKAGWEMLEKFDDYRIRFKRRIDNRSNDQYLKTDPYRTGVGLKANRLVAVAVALAILGVAFAALMAVFFAR